MRIKIDDVEVTNFFKMPKKIYDFDLKPVDRELYMLCSENWRLSVKNGWINEQGEIYFYATQAVIAKQMNVSKDTVITAFDRLINSGLLEVEKEIGKPNRYYLINLEVVENSDQSKNSTTPVEKPDSDQSKNSTTPVEKPDSNKNNTIRTNIVRINNKNNIYSSVVDYLNEKTGRKGKEEYNPKTKETQRLIRTRQKEGYSLDDFKKVIDNMCEAWKGTEWEQYLRPRTLFSNKFEDYLRRKQYTGKKQNSGSSLPEMTPESLKEYFGGI